MLKLSKSKIVQGKYFEFTVNRANIETDVIFIEFQNRLDLNIDDDKTDREIEKEIYYFNFLLKRKVKDWLLKNDFWVNKYICVSNLTSTKLKMKTKNYKKGKFVETQIYLRPSYKQYTFKEIFENRYNDFFEIENIYCKVLEEMNYKKIEK